MELTRLSARVFVLALLAVVTANAAIPSVRQKDYVYPRPVWGKLGKDDRGRMIRIRIAVRDGLEGYQFDLINDGKVLKSRVLRTGASGFPLPPKTVARVGNNWMVFFDDFPAMGSTFSTRYLLINRRTFAYTACGSFEHGDTSHFQSSHQFFEYKLLQYNEHYRDFFYPRYHRSGFCRLVWRWDARRTRFVHESSSLVLHHYKGMAELDKSPDNYP